jgi:Transposase DDE domain
MLERVVTGDTERAMSYGGKDIRVDQRGEEVLDAIVAKGSLVLRKIGGGRAGEVAAGRYLDNDDVTAQAIIATAGERTLAAARGRPVLAIQDTTEVNFSRRAARRTGLGPAGDGVSPGLFCHPLLLVDIEHEAVLGLMAADIWTRPQAPAGNRKKRPIDAKESGRWLDATAACRGVGEVAAQVVTVADREADLYEHFAARPDGVEMIVRARHDRATGADGRLFAAPETFDLMDVASVTVPPRGPGDKGRLAEVSIKAGRVEIVCPAHQRSQVKARGWPTTVSLGLVEIAEVSAPKGVTPLCWRLLTTLPVGTLAEATEVARLYRLRWRIEQLFRTFKSDGLDFEATQVTDARRLFKLAALGLVAAVRIMQLVDARDGGPRPATDVIDANQIAAVAAISAGLEGKTARQKNHHREGSLAWLSWVTARLGGWNCYYKPPGPKTMADGWKRLAERLQGYHLAIATKHV